MSGEEIEAGLIRPNKDLASLHIAILKVPWFFVFFC